MSAQLDGSTAVDPQRGNWIRTFSGGRFYLEQPRAEDVNVVDVAHALSHICRFTGHTERFYSVAEHCVRVSRLVAPSHALWGLLHDAAEAYLGDVARPLKHAPGMHGYTLLEVGVDYAVRQAFGIQLTPEMRQDVKQVDLHMLCVEARDLLGVTDFEAAGWSYWTEPSPFVRAVGWPPEMAEWEFLQRFRELTS